MPRKHPGEFRARDLPPVSELVDVTLWIEKLADATLDLLVVAVLTGSVKADTLNFRYLTGLLRQKHPT